MSEYLLVLAIALLPAGGSGIGSAIAESTRAPEWVVGSALHSAAGVAIAVVSVELMPRILAAVSNFRSEGVGRRMRIIAAFGLALPMFLGATIGFWVLRDFEADIQNGALALVVGILLLTTVEDTLPGR